MTATAELAKGLVYSPEFMALAAAKGPEAVARMAALEKAGRATRRAAMTGTAMARVLRLWEL